MVSRNSAFALTVMLLVSSVAQASWAPSLASLPALPSLSSVKELFSKENGVFAAKVAASLVVIDLTCKTARKLASYIPACVSGHIAHAHAKAASYVPARFQSAPAAPCPVSRRLDNAEANILALADRTTTLESQTKAQPAAAPSISLNGAVAPAAN